MFYAGLLRPTLVQISCHNKIKIAFTIRGFAVLSRKTSPARAPVYSLGHIAAQSAVLARLRQARVTCGGHTGRTQHNLYIRLRTN